MLWRWVSVAILCEVRVWRLIHMIKTSRTWMEVVLRCLVHVHFLFIYIRKNKHIVYIANDHEYAMELLFIWGRVWAFVVA